MCGDESWLRTCLLCACCGHCGTTRQCCGCPVAFPPARSLSFSFTLCAHISLLLSFFLNTSTFSLILPRFQTLSMPHPHRHPPLYHHRQRIATVALPQLRGVRGVRRGSRRERDADARARHAADVRTGMDKNSRDFSPLKNLFMFSPNPQKTSRQVMIFSF